MPQVFTIGHRAFMAGEQGDWEAAERLAGEALELAVQSGLQEHWACSTAHTVRGSVPGQDPEQALAALRRGAELARRGAGYVDIGHSLAALAAGERNAGNLDEARRVLGEAQEVLADCPDPGILAGMIASLERDLRAPAPARAAAPTGELSERELSVLRLLPTDLSQREIGDELYVSLNTVKSHTRSIFRKLRVGGREEAVARARELRLI